MKPRQVQWLWGAAALALSVPAAAQTADIDRGEAQAASRAAMEDGWRAERAAARASREPRADASAAAVPEPAARSTITQRAAVISPRVEATPQREDAVPARAYDARERYRAVLRSRAAAQRAARADTSPPPPVTRAEAAPPASDIPPGRVVTTEARDDRARWPARASGADRQIEPADVPDDPADQQLGRAGVPSGREQDRGGWRADRQDWPTTRRTDEQDFRAGRGVDSRDWPTDRRADGQDWRMDRRADGQDWRPDRRDGLSGPRDRQSPLDGRDWRFDSRRDPRWNDAWGQRGWDRRWAAQRFDRYGRPWDWSRGRRYVWGANLDPRFGFGLPWAWDPLWVYDPSWWSQYEGQDGGLARNGAGQGVPAVDLVRSDPIVGRWALIRHDRDRSGWLGPTEADSAARDLRRLADLNGDGRINDREYRVALDRLEALANRAF